MDDTRTPEQLLDDAILDATLELSRTQGWTSINLEQVAVAAQVELPNLVLRFPDKRRLGAGIMRRLLDQLPAELEDEIDADSPLQDRLYTCIAHELRMLEPHKDFVRWLMLESFNPFSPTAALQLPQVYRYLRVIRAQLELAKQRGESNKQVILTVAVGAFWVLHLRVIAYWLSEQSPGSEQTHAATARWLSGFVRTLQGVQGG